MIQVLRKDLTRVQVEDLIKEEVAKAAGLLNEEGAAHLVFLGLGGDGREEPETPTLGGEAETPPLQPFQTLDGKPVGDDPIKMDILRRLREAKQNTDLVRVEVTPRKAAVIPVRFLGDLWQDYNKVLANVGMVWHKKGPKDPEVHWEVTNKGYAIGAGRDEEEGPPRFADPMNINQTEAILAYFFPTSHQCLFTVTDTAKFLEIEPLMKLSPGDLVKMIYVCETYGFTKTDTGYGVGYSYTKKKNEENK